MRRATAQAGARGLATAHWSKNANQGKFARANGTTSSTRPAYPSPVGLKLAAAQEESGHLIELSHHGNPMDPVAIADRGAAPCARDCGQGVAQDRRRQGRPCGPGAETREGRPGDLIEALSNLLS